MHGNGVMEYKDGSKYDGNWKNSQVNWKIGLKKIWGFDESENTRLQLCRVYLEVQCVFHLLIHIYLLHLLYFIEAW